MPSASLTGHLPVFPDTPGGGRARGKIPFALPRTYPYALDDPEAPPRLTRGLTVLHAAAHRLSERGARTHLAGHGADELFRGGPTPLHTLLRRRPLTALRQMRVHRALRRWAVLPTLAGLLGPTASEQRSGWRPRSGPSCG
ncbi:asparagine synthase-related protein [Streptomyces sp. IBSNAI002]|uniref:asparagine synthase-related protein n=1 Tax=Streptomyces sp. IBSNAI002 TaxID=3457500 RepID=UPI003FD013E7